MRCLPVGYSSEVAEVVVRVDLEKGSEDRAIQCRGGGHPLRRNWTIVHYLKSAEAVSRGCCRTKKNEIFLAFDHSGSDCSGRRSKSM